MGRLLSKLHHRVRTTPWLGRWVLRLMPDLPWVINVKPIGKMSIRLRQHRMYWLRPPLRAEGFMLGGLQRLVRKGDVVYDIGANIGLYSRIIAQRFQASQVYAFEPFSSNCRMIEQNISRGGCASQVVLLPVAVGNEDGTCAFQVDDLTSNTGSLDAVKGGQASQSRAQYGMRPRTVAVPVTRLDSLIERNEIAKPDVIKLDVEGAEALALEGAAHFLSQHPCRLVIELHGPEVGKTVLRLLWGHGYHCFGYLEKDGTRTYQEIVQSDLGCLTERYSLAEVFASRNPDELTAPVQQFIA